MHFFIIFSFLIRNLKEKLHKKFQPRQKNSRSYSRTEFSIVTSTFFARRWSDCILSAHDSITLECQVHFSLIGISLWLKWQSQIQISYAWRLRSWKLEKIGEKREKKINSQYVSNINLWTLKIAFRAKLSINRRWQLHSSERKPSNDAASCRRK